MDDLSMVLVEVHRLQMLAFIARACRGDSFATSWDIAQWLRIPVDESSLLVGELEEEGFVEVGYSVSGPLCSPLRLTPVGAGVLEWNRRRTPRLSTPRNRPIDPPPAVL